MKFNLAWILIDINAHKKELLLRLPWSGLAVIATKLSTHKASHFRFPHTAISLRKLIGKKSIMKPMLALEATNDHQNKKIIYQNLS